MTKQLALSFILLLALAASTYGQYYGQYPWSPHQPVWPQYGPYIPADIYPAYTFVPFQAYIVDDFGGDGYYWRRPIYRRSHRR